MILDFLRKIIRFAKHGTTVLILVFQLLATMVMNDAVADSESCSTSWNDRECGQSAGCVNELFVSALLIIDKGVSTGRSNREIAECVVDRLQNIINNQPQSDIAVKLISGQKIGEVSLDWNAIERLAASRKRKFLKKNAPKATDGCACNAIRELIYQAQMEENRAERNAMLAAITRKSVRVNQLDCATAAANMVDHDDTRKSAKRIVSRARFRSVSRGKRSSCN